MTRAIALTFVLAAVAGAADAQTWPPHPGVTVHDQHRYEMDRLRLQADQRDLFARQQRLETQLRLQQLEAARQPALPAPQTYRPLGSVESEQAAREAATDRRERSSQAVGQIDAWLDRELD